MGSLPAGVKVLLIVLAVVVMGGLVWYLGRSKKLVSISPSPTSLTTFIQPQSGYTNPLDKNTQYSNPFASYKNPFDALK